MSTRRRELLAAAETQWYLIGRFTCTVTYNNNAGYSGVAYLWSTEPRSAFVGSSSIYLLRSGWAGPGMETQSNVTAIRRSDSSFAEILSVTTEDVPPTEGDIVDSSIAFFEESEATYTSGFGFRPNCTFVSSLNAYYLNSDAIITGHVDMNCEDMSGSGSTNNQVCPKGGNHNWQLQLVTSTICPYQNESASLQDYTCTKCGKTTRWYNCGHGGAIGEY